jgi:hypothetical protein
MKIKYLIIVAFAFVFNVNAQTTGSSTTATGTVEVEILSKQPFTFQLNRFNNKKTLEWTSAYSLDANMRLRNVQASLLPDMTVRIVGEVESRSRRDNDVVVIHFDQKGNLKWNSTLGNDSKLEVINTINDGNDETYVNVKADSETESDVYLIVCFGPKGETNYTTSYTSTNNALARSRMELKRELLEVRMSRNQLSETYLIDKKSGNIKSAPKTDASFVSAAGSMRPSYEFKNGSLNIRKFDGANPRNR